MAHQQHIDQQTREASGSLCASVCAQLHFYECVCVFITSGGSPCGLSEFQCGEKMLCGHTGESFTV